MNFALLVLSAPDAGYGARHAQQFARTTLAQGHQIARIFFLDAGTRCGGLSPVLPQDEIKPVDGWVELRQQHDIDLVLCVSSALRQGMLNAEEAARYERPGATIHEAFRIGGLGEWVEAAGQADRVVTFGG